MPRSGNLADWEHRLAAQRQDDQRLARERRQQEKEKEKARQQEHLDSRQRAADEQTAAVQERVQSLDDVLTSVLSLPLMSFDRLMATPRTPSFDPGPLTVAVPGPDWSDFAPAEPRGLERLLEALLAGGARRRRQLAQARARFDAASADHAQQESQRQQELAAARAKYHGQLSEERARAAARNAYVAGRRTAFDTRDAGSVEWYTRCVLKASRYPDDFPRGYQVAYDPRSRTVWVEFELPPRSVVPPVRTHWYVRQRDVIESQPRPDHEIRRRYERLVSCIALRTLHEIFSATAPGVVQVVSFTGYVSTTDAATGKPGRPHLLTVSAERPVFEDLVLAAVEPAACLEHLGAQRPPGPDAPPEPEALELGVPLGGLEHVHQGPEGF